MRRQPGEVRHRSVYSYWFLLTFSFISPMSIRDFLDRGRLIQCIEVVLVLQPKILCLMKKRRDKQEDHRRLISSARLRRLPVLVFS